MCVPTVLRSYSELAGNRGSPDTLPMQFQNHDEFPKFDHRALPSRQ